MNKPTAMEIKGARAACKRHAEICNVDEQDLWKMHGEEFIEDAKLVLDSAGASELLEALKGLDEAYCRASPHLTKEERQEDRMRLIKAREAIANAEVTK
jgi:hypothetical protein